MNIKDKSWIALIILATLACVLFASSKRPPVISEPTHYENYAAELEARQRLPTEDVAWLIKTFDALFSHPISDYKSQTAQAISLYLTPSAVSSYYALLEGWGLSNNTDNPLYDFSVEFLEKPLATGIQEFSIPYIDGPYTIGSITIYTIKLRTILMDGSDIIRMDKKTLEAFVGTTYPNNKRIITEIKTIVD